MSTLTNIIGALIPKQSYTVGGKSSGSNIPVELTLKLDPDFKKTLLKSVGILSLGIGTGIAAGLVITEAKKSRRSRT